MKFSTRQNFFCGCKTTGLMYDVNKIMYDLIIKSMDTSRLVQY